MSRFDDFQSALENKVTFHGQPSSYQRDAVAHILSGTNIPVEHAANLNAIHAGANIPTTGLYRRSDRSVLLRGNPDSFDRMPSMLQNYRRAAGHEIGHSRAHTLNPRQFDTMMGTAQGRGVIEAHAEDYADKHVPGSYSSYDHLVRTQQPTSVTGFDSRSYRNARGPRYGNVDPRLTSF